MPSVLSLDKALHWRPPLILNPSNHSKDDANVFTRSEPFLPDTKPVIDRSPRLNNVLMAFGHGQLGLTLGATTGRLVTDLAADRQPAQDLTPFCAHRFALIGGLA
ncbi:hypothetical protein PAMH27_2447 [Pseudomonas aeruginosa MH27]|nr:hypothetical protein PAMH27_2447 [Pseudomonas aeruginosa MH27]